MSSALAPLAATAAPLGILLDYAAGVIKAADIKASGAGVRHAKRGWELHVAAGGSFGAPIYTSIDDDPAMSSTRRRSPHICAAGSR